jgi:hypothetical protein
MNPVGSKCQGKRSALEEAGPQQGVDQEKIWKTGKSGCLSFPASGITVRRRRRLS